MLDWIRRRTSNAAADELNRELREIEEAAAAMSNDPVRAQHFNRAGDLCVTARQVRRGLVYYGRAVDAYLQAGYTAPAAAMCRKILRHSPEAVRAHCTLACLAAHGQHVREVKTEIRFLVEASRRTHTERLTVARLRLLADAVADREVKEYIAEQLRGLGDELGSERIATRLQAERPHRGDSAGDDGRWEKLVLAAALDPDELWKYA